MNIDKVQSTNGFIRTVAGVVLVTFTTVTVSPAAHAAFLPAANSPPVLPEVTADEVHAQLLESLFGEVSKLSSRPGSLSKIQLNDLQDIHSRLKHSNEDLLQEFSAVKRHLEDNKLPAVVFERLEAMRSRFTSEASALDQELSALERDNESAGSRLTSLRQHLSKLTERPHRRFDRGQLPIRKHDKAREPRVRKQDFAAWVTTETSSPVQLAALDPLSALVTASAAANVPGPEFLGSNAEVQITPEIRELAQQLHNNPVEIFNWVYNNIQFVPTFGAIQGSQFTLQSKRGNAFDTSSLLLALLRAGGIPSRYVYGTIEVPVDTVMNWFNVSVPEAAQQILGQGGIPNTAIVQGGRIKSVRLEHVWVEAFVDFVPSRGSKNISPDSWVPLDAALKRYDHVQGMQVRENTNFDAGGATEAALQGSNTDVTGQFISGINDAALQAQLQAYRQPLTQYIDQQNPDATAAQIIGSTSISALNRPILAATTPYRTVVVAQRLSALPDTMRHKFRYSLYTDSMQRSLDNPLFRFEQATSELAGKKLAFVFVPASAVDQQTLMSYLPQADSSGVVSLDRLPQSLPAYLIHVRAELRVDGVVVASAGSFPLGTELVGEGGFTSMDLHDWDLTSDTHIAGQSGGLGISLQGITSKQLADARDQLKDSISKAASGDTTLLAKELDRGGVLTDVVWQYFASVEDFGRVAQREAGMVDFPGLSYGFFFSEVVPVKLYGIVVTQAKYVGGLMDIGHQRRISISKNNDLASWIEYNQTRGTHSSAMEHTIPEVLFAEAGVLLSDPAQPQAVSAVKALRIASDQGQRIFTLNAANAAQLANIHLASSVLDDISTALTQGMDVTVHESPISYAGFNGAGYIVTDPETGAGAYLIQDGAHGAKIAKKILTVLGIVLFFTGTAAVSPFLLGLLAGITIFLAFYSVLLNAIDILDKGGKCANLAAERYLEFFVPLTLIGILFKSKSATSLMLKLLTIMYGADLFKGVAESKACQ